MWMGAALLPIWVRLLNTQSGEVTTTVSPSSRKKVSLMLSRLVSAPAMTGDPLLERTIRAHYNTLEWLPIFLVSLWMFAVYWNELVAAALGVVWIVGRIVYALGYYAAPERRETGFLIQSLATAVLLFGALGKIVYGLATGGV